MDRTGNKIISASRRTDIPGWYTPWFLEQVRLGFFTIKNPYNQVKKRVDVLPQNIHSIVFWSKNFGPFLDLSADRILSDMGYHLYFNATVNSRNTLLEPGLPALSERLGQVNLLCERFGPDKISWRFDPLCFYRTDDGHLENNLGDFTLIADAMAEMGITRCVSSFYDDYQKVLTRARYLSLQGTPLVTFADPKKKDRQKIVQRMADYLETKNINLYLCCETALVSDPGSRTSIRPNACIDGRQLKHLYGGDPEIRRDYGQRSRQGCRCTRSVDIGAYEDHPCFHNCLFCYANTGTDTQLRQRH
ncbi:MAG: DUF1848 domain-containing protein [Proteobacteria bacterium]|nr:DUF1848 domain-containing protein [Pseudomonadota bacterium]